ncbi:T9SS type A sorting domain-containing protein [Algibacter mikhailovii]|uniref:T9SS type A sorting domain-containing protein n=1 Tax=Algibacter mikhailovii TaxID=425498 RepID=UPI002494D19E|nr:T9SS type A sorting domain-containing protein [Algibacter mikhailovii]
MKKITLKISAFLLLSVFALQVQAQALYTEPGSYKISTSGVTPELYMTIDGSSGDLVWAEELTGDFEATQIWTIQDHITPASAGYVQITADLRDLGLGLMTMVVDRTTINPDPAVDDKEFRITVRQGVPQFDVNAEDYGFDQFQRRKAKVNDQGLADPDGTNPADGNNALFVKPSGASGASRYGVVPSAAGEQVLFDGGGIDVIQYHLQAPLSNEKFDTSSLFISNPVNDQLTIKGLTSSVSKVSVFNLLGSSVLSKNIDGESTINMNVSGLAAGMYIVKLEGLNGTFSKKIIKQ